jgi:hypothetical protein
VKRAAVLASRKQLDALPWAHTSPRFRAFDHRFTVRTSDAALGKYLDAVLDPFADDTTGESVERVPAYSMVDRGEGVRNRFVLYFDRERVVLSPSGSLVVATLLWHVNRYAIDSGGHYLLVHAGAVTWDGRAAIFPAAMESGKTTLVAGLVRAGARYLSDEAAAIDPGSLLVHPFAKAMTVGSGSKEVLADILPVVDPEVARRYLLTDVHVDARTIRADAIAPPTPVAFVIAPRYEKGATTALTPLTRAEAVLEMGRHSFNLPDHGRRGVEALAEIARGSTCHRLVVGDLDVACTILSDVLSSPHE